jgi:hypothetical protein
MSIITCLCTQNELEELLEVIEFNIGEYFDIREVKREYSNAQANPTPGAADKSSKSGPAEAGDVQ